VKRTTPAPLTGKLVTLSTTAIDVVEVDLSFLQLAKIIITMINCINERRLKVRSGIAFKIYFGGE
jgi:hypothetical protein